MSTARDGQDHSLATGHKLVSWKSIANYFDCDERTAKRWERERGLPVHRAPGGRRSAVYAYSSELEAWLRPGISQRAPFLGTSAGTPSLEDRDAPSPTVDAEGPNGTEVASLKNRRLPLHLTSQLIALGAVVILLFTASLPAFKGQKFGTQKTSTAQAATGSSRHIPAAGAEDLYLQGRYYWNLRTADSLLKAINLYTEAIVKDPSYAEAYAGLAESYDLLPEFAHGDLARSFARAKDAADTAIELNPNLAAAHRAKGFALFFWDWDVPGSDSEFRRALALDPNSAETHQWYASTLLNRLEGTECLKQIDEALRLNPGSAAIATEAAFVHEEFGNDPNASIRKLEELEKTQPTLETPSYFLMTIDLSRGDYQAYILELHRIASITHQPDDVAMASAATRGWAQSGKTGLLAQTAEVQEGEFKRGIEPGFRLGQTYLLLGRPKEAFFYFRASLGAHFILLTTMQDCDWSKKLMTDPEYATLFAQIRARKQGWQTNRLSVLPTSFRLPTQPQRRI